MEVLEVDDTLLRWHEQVVTFEVHLILRKFYSIQTFCSQKVIKLEVVIDW